MERQGKHSMEKLIMTAALMGNVTLPVLTPYMLITPKQINDDAVCAAEAGAASWTLRLQTNDRSRGISENCRRHQDEEQYHRWC